MIEPIIVSLKKLYNDWFNLFRHKDRESEFYQQQESNFHTKLGYLFDIADVKALKIIRVEEDRLFLQAQWEPGRKGFMAELDIVGFQIEKM